MVKYEDMAEVPFGKPGIYFASFMVNSFLLFLSGAYLILIGSSLEFVTNAWLPYRHWVSRRRRGDTIRTTEGLRSLDPTAGRNPAYLHTIPRRPAARCSSSRSYSCHWCCLTI